MVDVRKAHRGVLLNREDILKCARCAKVSLSSRVRELLHADMEKYSLDEAGRKILAEQVRAAERARKEKCPNAGTRGGSRAFACGYEEIPDGARKGVRFVGKRGRKHV